MNRPPQIRFIVTWHFVTIKGYGYVLYLYFSRFPASRYVEVFRGRLKLHEVQAIALENLSVISAPRPAWVTRLRGV